MTSRDRDRAGRGLALRGLLAAAVAGLLVLAVGVARGEEEKPSYSPFNGKVTFKTYCMNCHGIDAKGNGPLAEHLNVEPTDLTRLSAENGGVFPEDRVRRSIDGRAEIKGHGSREMPVWGDAFLWPEDDTPERRAHVERKIGELVEYLRTVQEPSEEKPGETP